MRHFATESGKSKGQFYTPAEVSRVIAQILGIRHAKTTNDTTVYDRTPIGTKVIVLATRSFGA
jgi:type I restriction enzyme M protein